MQWWKILPPASTKQRKMSAQKSYVWVLLESVLEGFGHTMKENSICNLCECCLIVFQRSDLRPLDMTNYYCNMTLLTVFCDFTDICIVLLLELTISLCCDLY